MASQEEKISLVLSIFKGKNFVCQDTSGFRCQIEAKCFSKVLESGVISIYSNNSEPIFNSQLAWQFTRRELRQIREKKEAVKVKCLLLNDVSKTPTELGYVILHVKDAFPLSGIEVDPLKAKCYPLLGTKEQWKNYRPELQMQLHIEENLQPRHVVSSSPKIKSDVPHAPPKTYVNTVSKPVVADFVDSAPRMKQIPEMMTDEKFSWKINGEEGCFELGNLSDSDDLYILNVTIISASYLHLLWNGRSPKKASNEDFVWQVKYKAYGCEIKSDPFVLNNEDEITRRTFIGDKATARIRANAALFYDYLQDTALEFQVVRFQLAQDNTLTNEEVMGVSFAELQDLAKHDVGELKTCLEIVSEWGYPRVVSHTDKPEVRVVFQLDAIPGFFTNRKQSDDVDRKFEASHESSKIDAATPTVKKCDEHQYSPKKNGTTSAESKLEEEDKHSSINDIMREIRELEIREELQKNQQESNSVAVDSNKAVCLNQNKPELRNEMMDEIDFGHGNKNSPAKSRTAEKPSSFQSNKPVESDGESSSTSSSSNTSERSRAYETNSNSFTSPEKEVSNRQQHDDSLSSCTETSDKENLGVELPKPGKYEIKIGLSKCWMKSKLPIKDELLLSYVHPRFGIKDDSVVCVAKPSLEMSHKKPHYQCMMVKDGVNVIEVSFQSFSEKLINEPLTVDFRKYTKKGVQPTFAFSMIPVGSILLLQEANGKRTLKGIAEILKSDTNLKIGVLNYFVEFTSLPIFESRLRHRDSTDHPLHAKNQKPSIADTKEKPRSRQYVEISDQEDMNAKINPALVFHTVEELASWKLEQEKMFVKKKEDKERAYLRILSEEAAKREKEREKTWSEKVGEFKKKEKALDQQARRVAELEEKLKLKEMEVASSSQQAALSHTSVLENAKLSIRRMQEEHQIELSSLHRRNTEYEADLEKLKGKLLVYERRLEEKEEKIRKIMAEGQYRPDIRLSEKYKLLEQENKLLKKQIIETERSRDQYKKQSQTLCHKLARLQEERDKQLKDENENLRLQILASKEHKEMKKERKAVADLSETIRALQDTAKSKDQDNILTKARNSEEKSGNNKHRSSGGRKPVAKEDEIARLTEVRNGLLSTGAYTQYDMVIKEMERRIVNFCEDRGDREDHSS